MSAAVQKPRTEVIEQYFKKYPDVPREVILKPDLLNLGHRFSEAALEATSGAIVKSYRLFSYDLVPMQNMSRQEYRKVPEWFTICKGPYQLRPVQVQTTLALDSPYLIDVIDGKLWLCVDGRQVAQVAYPRASGFDSKTFEDGTAHRDIIAFGSFITVFRFCQFWGVKEECKFCDINENARQMKADKSYTVTGPVKEVAKVAEAAKEFEREARAQAGYPIPLTFMVTGGSITSQLNGKTEDDFYMEYVEALKWGGPRRKIKLQTNAKDKETLKRYRACGVDCHDANMEVWDRRLFEWICPGKAQRVGYDEWIRRIVDSVDVFGEGNVQPNFVCGVEMARPYGFKTVEEAVKSTTEGVEFLMSHGVCPRFNHWRRETRAYLAREYDQPPPPLDFYIQLMRNRYEIWKKYSLPLPYSYNSYSGGALPDRHAMGAVHGTYSDYILLMEDKDYLRRAYEALNINRGGAIWGPEPCVTGLREGVR